MLLLLEVQNLALIDNLSFYPGEGLNVITGETGAGKSMLLGAISLLLGERATPDAVRAGEDAAYMQAVFAPPPGLASPETAPEGQLSLCREIRASGPNLCRLNGRVQPLAAMSALGRQLVDLHGQNKQQSLLDPDTQRSLLDAFAGVDLLALLADVGQNHRTLSALRRELAALGGDDAAVERHAGYLRFQLEEIEAAALSAEEEEELDRQFRRLSHAQQLGDVTAKLYAEIYEGSHAEAIVDRLGLVEKELAAAVALDETLGDLLDRVASVAAQLTEAARELRNYQDTIHLDEAELQGIILRLETYKKVKKKYGPAVDHVLALAEQIRAELREMDGRSGKRASLEESIRSQEITMQDNADALSVLRKQAAAQLADKINKAMHSLALQGAQLEIRVEPSGQTGPHGCDHVEFFFSANTGEPLRPLAKTASGGEISRVMLAIKSVLAEQDAVPTLIFDEIDAGIGGHTVRSVAGMLHDLAAHRQVICVTHQPLIAAAAHHHFVIYKEEVAGRTVTRLRKLKEEERAPELARMLGGEAGSALDHARQLLTENQ